MVSLFFISILFFNFMLINFVEFLKIYKKWKIIKIYIIILYASQHHTRRYTMRYEVLCRNSLGDMQVNKSYRMIHIMLYDVTKVKLINLVLFFLFSSLMLVVSYCFTFGLVVHVVYLHSGLTFYPLFL